MATNKTIPNPLPPGADQLETIKQGTRAVEDYSYQVMDAQTANNRVGPEYQKISSLRAVACTDSLKQGVGPARPHATLPVTLRDFADTCLFGGKADID
jgi:hypothetical protein